MKRIALALLLVFVADLVAAAPPEGDDKNAVAPVVSQIPAVMPLMVQQPTQPAVPFDRIMYVLDVSGSMRRDLPRAIQATAAFASDSFKATVVTFNCEHKRWDGVKVKCKHAKKVKCNDRCLEPGWAWMPLHYPELLGWMGSFTGSGGTDPTSALDYAFKHAPEGTLIVFISDGGFDHKDDQDEGKRIVGPMSAIRRAQAWRRTKKLAPVQMLVWAVSEADSKEESLVELAKLGGGGLWREDTPPEPTPTPDPHWLPLPPPPIGPFLTPPIESLRKP